MTLGARLGRAWYARPSPEVARDLLGRILVRDLDGRRLSVRIVETEAYGQDDPASHSFRGMTRRNATMFGAAGHAYVYFTYGMHWCLNVVTGARGEGSAVLIRAGEPLEGLEVMARNRGVDDVRRLCRGPANLARALGLDGAWDGIDLVRGAGLRIHAGAPVPRSGVRATPRIGIREGTERPWRFVVAGDGWHSGPRIARARHVREG